MSILYSAKVELFNVSFERLDFGDTEVLDQFYNADVAIVDMSIRCQQAALSYHIGVRQNMGYHENVIMLHDTDPEFTLSAKVMPLRVFLCSGQIPFDFTISWPQ